MTFSASTHDSDRLQNADSPASRTTAVRSGNLSNQQVSSEHAPSNTRYPPGGEEPEIALEPDLPSDGRDFVGEAMIRDLPQRPELSEAPSQPDPSSQQT